MNKKLDDILYDSLSPIYEPDSELNRQILEASSKEVLTMKHFKFRKTAAAAVMACIVAVGGMTAYAAYRCLSPSQIAGEVSDNNALAKAFESDSAIAVDETQTSGDYNITLLGLVSGAGLSPYIDEEQTGSLDEKQSYAALAISRTDEQPMEEENKCISPLINGVDWMVANNGTMDAGLHWFVKDGVVYELLECDNLEIFAGRGVQIGVVDSFGNESSAFTMDEKTGVYKKNDGYEGTCALFDLPLDKSKGDEKAAEAYIEKLMAGEEDSSVTDEASETDGAEKTPGELAYDKYMEELDAADDQMAFLEEHAEPVEGSRRTLTMDEEGLVDFKQDTDEGTVYVKGLETGVPTLMCISGGMLPDTLLHVFTLNEDGSVTYEAYAPTAE